MSYSIKSVTQYAVINNNNGQSIAVCRDMSEATAIVNAMAGHGTWVSPVDGQVHKLRNGIAGRPYTFTDWARKH